MLTTWWNNLHSREKVRRSPEARLTPWTYPVLYQQPHPWTTAIKLIKFLQVGTCSFEGHKSTVSPLLGKAINLFLSTSPWTLSPRFDLAPGHRGWVFAITHPSLLPSWRLSLLLYPVLYMCTHTCVLSPPPSYFSICNPVQFQFSRVDSATPWTTARQASLFITNSWSLTKLMSIESVMPPNYLILCCPLPPPALNLSQHQGLFKWVSSLHQVAKVLEFQLHHQSFQWTPRTDLLQDGLVGSPCSSRDSQESSPTPQFKSINSTLFSIYLTSSKLEHKHPNSESYLATYLPVLHKAWDNIWCNEYLVLLRTWV